MRSGVASTSSFRFWLHGSLLLNLILFALPGVADSPTCKASKLLDQALSTYGQTPKPNLEVLSSIRFFKEGKQNNSKTLRELYQFPSRIRFEYQTDNTIAIVGTDGHHTWRATEHGSTFQRPAHFIVPLRLRNLSAILKQARSASAHVECLPGANHNLQRLLITLPTKEMIFLDLDPQSGLVYYYQGESPDTGSTDVIEVTILEWKQVSGVWVASHFETRVGGHLATKTKMQRAKLPPHIPTSLFIPPHKMPANHQ